MDPKEISKKEIWPVVSSIGCAACNADLLSNPNSTTYSVSGLVEAT